MNRRAFLAIATATSAWLRVGHAATLARRAALPAEVAGIRLPRSPLTMGAASLARERCPDYLFNHCMRTYVFGALLLRRRGLAANPEIAFVASALHDLGLLQPYESATGSFEIDGANAAETFMLRQRRAAKDADRVWRAVELHDGKWPLTEREGPEAMLVSLGAGSDVYGLDPGDLDQHQINEVLAAFPRLQFKQRFTTLLIVHCMRKPNSQHGTWLEGVCRRHAAGWRDDAVEARITGAGFSE